MTASSTETIRERVAGIEVMPAIPAVFLPLLKLLGASAEEAKVDEVVRLVSYDNTIAAPNVCGWLVHPCSAWRSRPNPSRER